MAALVFLSRFQFVRGDEAALDDEPCYMCVITPAGHARSLKGTETFEDDDGRVQRMVCAALGVVNQECEVAHYAVLCEADTILRVEGNVESEGSRAAGESAGGMN